MTGLVAWWARNHVASNLLMIFIVLIGFGTYFTTLNREALPSISPERVRIYVDWRGASPTDVEEQIILRIEESLADLENVKELNSIAREGLATVIVDMETGGDMDAFLNEVKSRVDGVNNLPTDAYQPVVARESGASQLAWIDLTGDIDPVALNRLAIELRDELAAIPGGTPLVSVNGLRSEEVSIEVSELALRQYGLTFDDVASAVRNSSLNLSMGEIRTDTGNIPLASRNLADTAAEFSRIVVKQNRDGSIIRVGDIATVLDGFPDNNFIFRIDGKAGVTFELRQPKNDDIVKIMRNVRRWIDERQATLPEGVKLELDFTLEEFYEGRLTLVRDNAAQGLVLVLLVLMLFLRPAVAFWVAIGIAVSFIGTFIFLPIVGVSLNMLSLFGLLLVIGIVVDDALVVGESINRQVELGREGLEAAVLGTQLVLKPVVFAVLTTMLAFSPFLVIGGTFGPFVESIAWTIILALTFSLIESFIILPSHLANLKPPSDIALLRLQRRFADSLLWFAQNYYKPVVTKALEFRSLTITIFLGLMSMAISLVGQGWIPMSFAPNIENNFIQGQITMQDGTAWSRKRQVLERVEQATAELKATLREERGGEIILSASAWANDNSSAINSFINLAEADIAGIGSNEISERLRDLIGPIPDAVEIRLDTSAGQDSGGFTVGVKSSDREQSRRATEEIKAYLRGVPQLFDVRDSMQAPLDELRLKLRPGAERFGVSVNEVSRQLRQAYLGEEIQRLPRGGQDVLVTVRYPLESRQSLKSLFTEFRIRTSDGREIPASAVVEFETGPAVRSIERLDRKRSVAIYARKREGADVGPIKKKFFEEIQPAIQARYPAVSIERRGEDKQQFDFFSTLAFLGGAALLSIYMLLAIAFSSYFQPMLIMSAIPFGFTGAVFGHLLFGVDFSVFSFFGIGAAAGVVVNDNLVLVDYVNRLRAQGAGALAALVEAGTVRFRPILLTSVTTFIGLLPIIFEDSLDAQFLKPVAISLAFGVAFALFVTLLFVPAMYAVGADLSRFITGLVTGKRQPRLGEGASQESLPEILGAGREPSSPNAPAE